MCIREGQIRRQAIRETDRQIYRQTEIDKERENTNSNSNRKTNSHGQRHKIYTVYTYPTRYSRNLTPLYDGMVRVRYICLSYLWWERNEH